MRNHGFKNYNGEKMDVSEQQHASLATTSDRTVALRQSANSLVRRGCADLAALSDKAETTLGSESQMRGVMMALVHNAAKRLFAKSGRGPTFDELTAESGFGVNDVIAIHQSFFADPAFRACEIEFHKALRQASYREREVFKLLYGISDGYSYSYDEVCQIFKTTQEVVHADERNATTALLAYFEGKQVPYSVVVGDASKPTSQHL